MNTAHNAVQQSVRQSALQHNLQQLNHLNDGLAGLIELLHHQNTEHMISIAHLLTPMHKEWTRLMDEINDLTHGSTR